MLLLWIVLFSLLGSVGAILAAGTLLSFEKRTLSLLMPCLISYATGTLLASASLGLLAHALKEIPAFPTLSAFLGGLILFFVLEKLIIWRHCHVADCEVHSTAAPMILIGDVFHNFVDGVVIAASFLSAIPLGIVVGISTITHEVAQEVGDFAILLHGGYTKTRALTLNLTSSLSTLPGALIGFLALGNVKLAVPYVMAISAASFVYIALVDLAPDLHRRVGLKFSIQQSVLLLAGIATVVAILQVHP
jgi:zinc and cadmium transporter